MRSYYVWYLTYPIVGSVTNIFLENPDKNFTDVFVLFFEKAITFSYCLSQQENPLAVSQIPKIKDVTNRLLIWPGKVQNYH